MYRRGFLKQGWVAAVLATSQKIFCLRAKSREVLRELPVLSNDSTREGEGVRFAVTAEAGRSAH
jgi:hypothetical protein